MDVQVPPIVRGEFVYRDTLLVDVGGDGKRHPRAAEAELKTFLNGKAPKDQTAHWYEAQLIHYGLQRSKEKNTAKVRLQQGLNQGKLKAAPQHIADMESQMKKDYASAVRKAKSQNKAASNSNSDETTSKARKRKNDEVEPQSSKRSKIVMKIGDISINIDHSVAPSPKKKTSARTAEITPKASTIVAPKEKNQPPTPKAASSTKTAKPKSNAGNDNPATPTAKPTTAKSKLAKDESQQSPAKQAPKLNAEPKRKVTPKVKAESNTSIGSKVKSESKVKKEPNVKRESPIKKEAKVKDEDEGDDTMLDRSNEDPRQRNVTGVYNLSCPQLEEEFPGCNDYLRMFLAVDKGEIWGGFELCMKSGVVKFDDTLPDRRVSFGWRARDSEDGQLSFGRGCFGDIELYGHEQTRGTFYNLFGDARLEPLMFEGQRRQGQLWSGRSK